MARLREDSLVRQFAGREQTTLRLPAELKDQLQREAERRGLSFNAYLLLLIDKGRQSER